jgi:hypothetical protein
MNNMLKEDANQLEEKVDSPSNEIDFLKPGTDR